MAFRRNFRAGRIVIAWWKIVAGLKPCATEQMSSGDGFGGRAAARFAGPICRPAAIGPHCLSAAVGGGVRVQEGPAGCESVRPGASACVPGVGIKGHRRRHEWMRRVR